MEIATIGFTQSSAEHFFGRLREGGVRRLLDIRLNNVSQLAGFAKRDDLEFFLRELCAAEYQHEPLLAPTPDLLEGIRTKSIQWSDFEGRYLSLLEERRVEEEIDPTDFETSTVLLCSESTADRCHRRLAGEYLQAKWGNLRLTHL
ncbi:MAG: DUF488 family protein [Dehalococcoidia bacterium]|nr:DUF488 family protein [Dehalococcoidia bacterium]